MPRASASEEPPEYVVVAWTTLKIPLSITIEQRKTKDQKDFMSLMSCNTYETPGFLRALYGRVKEHPETVWLLTLWENHAALDAFEATDAHAHQRVAFSSLSTNPPDTHRCHIDGHIWNSIADHNAITDAFFLISISDEDREKAEKVRGLQYFFAPGGGLPSAYTRRGNRGWVQGTQSYEGTPAKVLRFLDFWKSAEAEQEFKTLQGVMLDDRFVGIYEYLKEQLSDAGMIGLQELHCKFLEIPDFFIDGRPPPDSDEEVEDGAE